MPRADIVSRMLMARPDATPIVPLISGDELASACAAWMAAGNVPGREPA